MTDLEVAINRIQMLAVQDEDVEDPPPTPELIAHAVELCRMAAHIMTHPFPRAAASSDEDGNIAIYWRADSRKALSVTLYNDRTRNFLYHRETGHELAIEYQLSPQMLAHWLDWYSVAADAQAGGET